MAFELAAYAAQCGVADPEGFVLRCDALRELLVAANQTVNLTRITAKEEFAVKHVADSLSIAREFPELATQVLSVADIGCGAGFPSLVLAAAFPNLQITAIDSTGKKTAFVERAASSLGLRNIRVVQGRSSELNRQAQFRHQFEVVTARAVAAASTICREARDFPRRRTGRFIFYKTPQQAAEELPALTAAGRKCPLVWRVTSEFELPEGAGRRLFLCSVPDCAEKRQ